MWLLHFDSSQLTQIGEGYLRPEGQKNYGIISLRRIFFHQKSKMMFLHEDKSKLLHLWRLENAYINYKWVMYVQFPTMFDYETKNGLQGLRFHKEKENRELLKGQWSRYKAQGEWHYHHINCWFCKLNVLI